MVQASEFAEKLKKNNLRPVIEVPCSIFTDLINFLLDSQEIEVVNPVNEAVVMAHAAGEYMATGKIPVVMMQNSGLNNTLNALTSLNKQYGIPAIYLISWRGELKDAPEHNFMGSHSEKILDAFQVPSKILSENYSAEIEWAASLARQIRHPTALIMRKGFIDKYEKRLQEKEAFLLDRWQAIETIVDNSKDAAYVSTNGFPSRQLYNILKQKGKDDGRAFTMVGSMGHALGIGLGVAKKTPKAKIIVIDGDGGALMHLGSMAGVAKYKPTNLVYVILDNRAYGSTGTQPSLSPHVDFRKIGESFGYKVYTAQTQEELVKATQAALTNGPALIHVKINQKEISKEDVKMGRVLYSCDEVRERFEAYLTKFK